ncbi:MAG TPA: hypothetical protein VEH76_14070 [Methylocystis sp.]|nr:hypothetical protein [Methylocystis sp.]
MSINLSGGLTGLEGFLNNLNSTGLSNLQALGGSINVLGTANASNIGSLLGEVVEFYEQNDAAAITSVRIQIASLLSNPSSAVKNAISNVWAQAKIANNAANVATAVSSAQTALGA